MKNNNDKISVAICGTGAALPEQRVTNADLEKIVETSDEWIVSRTGIRERRKLEQGLSNIDLTARAAEAALQNAGLDPAQLDLIIVATITPDHITPSTSCILQARLGAYRAAAMDISAGCTGYIYAVATAQQFIQTGIYRNALVLGTEILTRITNWEDRSTCVLFGDGSGAAVLQPCEKDRGIIAFELNADGRGWDQLIVPAGGSALPASAETVRNNLHGIKMNGNEIFKFAVRVVEETLSRLLERAGLNAEDIDFLFLHQANLRIIEHVRKKLKLSPERVPVNIDRYGNISSATIPVAVHEEAAAGRLKKGSIVAMIAFGSGLTYGGILMKW